MKVTLTIDDRAFIRHMERVQREAPREFHAIATTLAAQGRELARDNVTHQIYATPQRSGYKRTRLLIRSIFGEAEATPTGAMVTIGAAAHYAAYNEFGTYDGFDMLGGSGGALGNLIYLSRQVNGDARQLEFGQVERGLEPRPYIIPALIQLEMMAPEMMAAAHQRLLS